MKTKEFPRQFRSSSAAYRAIRQYEEKIGLSPAESGLIMTKIGKNQFLASTVPSKMTFNEFKEKRLNVEYPDGVYRYYPDGLSGEGYYEQKTGNRRRPNSKFIPLDTVYNDFISELCK